MSERVEALLFDLGGVLIELDWDAVFTHWAQGCGADPRALRSRFGFDAPYERHELGQLDAAGYFAALRASLAIDIPDARFEEGWGRLFTGPVPETVELVRALQGRVPLHLFSNTNAAHQGVWARDYAAALAPFERVFTSCEIGQRKPDRSAFEHVARAIGVAPERILFFDDTLANVEGARASGLQAVHVRSPEDVRRAVAAWLSSR